MDSIIRQVVREELRHSNSSRPETPSSTNQDDQGRSENKVRFRHEQWAVWGVFLKRRPKDEDLRPPGRYSLIRA